MPNNLGGMDALFQQQLLAHAGVPQAAQAFSAAIAAALVNGRSPIVMPLSNTQKQPDSSQNVILPNHANRDSIASPSESIQRNGGASKQVLVT